MLERGIREFGIGMSYAIFTGIGIAGTTVMGLVFFGESAGVLKIVSLLVLLAGIIGLKFCEGADDADDPGNADSPEGADSPGNAEGTDDAGRESCACAAAGHTNGRKESEQL